jgi:retinol dehydrogenase-12
VINTASSAADSGSVDFATFRNGQPRHKKGTHMLYLQSKLGNVLVSNELARRYAADGIISVSLNPGNLDSELQRHVTGVLRFIIVRLPPPCMWYYGSLIGVQNKITYPTHLGALTQLWAGTSPEGIAMSGKYLWPWAREGTMPAGAGDVKLQEEVWKWCEEQVESI